MMDTFTGTGTALVTPFKASDKSVDFEALEKLIEFQIENKVDFLLSLGTTAETATMSHEERHQVYNFTREKINGRVPLMVGFGGNNTAEVIKHLKEADLKGVDGILSVVPYYSKPTQEGIFQHFMAIAEASPVPIMLYNVPGRCGANMDAETTIRLFKASDKFIGIKEASGDIAQVKEIVENVSTDKIILSGDDAVIYDVCKVGGKGVISVMSNAFPAKTVQLTNNCMSKSESSEKEQQSYADLIDLLFKEGNPAGVKAFLHQKGIIENVLRLPLVPVSDATYKEISDF